VVSQQAGCGCPDSFTAPGNEDGRSLNIHR
jgi:hypothetical protein